MLCFCVQSNAFLAVFPKVFPYSVGENPYCRRAVWGMAASLFQQISRCVQEKLSEYRKETRRYSAQKLFSRRENSFYIRSDTFLFSSLMIFSPKKSRFVLPVRRISGIFADLPEFTKQGSAPASRPERSPVFVG